MNEHNFIKEVATFQTTQLTRSSEAAYPNRRDIPPEPLRQNL